MRKVQVAETAKSDGLHPAIDDVRSNTRQDIGKFEAFIDMAGASVMTASRIGGKAVGYAIRSTGEAINGALKTLFTRKHSSRHK